MQYYTFEFDEESKDRCTIATPYGLYKYNRLPMGLKCAPDITQEYMDQIFRDLKNDTEVYFHYIGCFSNDSWERHLKLLHRILSKLLENGFTVNSLKYQWGVKETNCFGYCLRP